MLAAILAAVFTVLVLVGVFAVVLFVRHNRSGSVASSTRMNVAMLDTVVSAEGNEASGGTQVSSQPQQTANIGESLKSRFTAMALLSVGIFGSLAAKAWVIQVLNGDTYKQESDENQYTTVTTPAPRGCIFDADGIELVRNRTSLTVLADSDVADDRTTMLRLSAVLGIPLNIVRARIQDTSSGAQSQRVVASDVDLRSIAFISEHASAFPGVTVQERAAREYPWGALAAHVLGYSGTASEDDLEDPAEGSELETGDSVGKTGIEAEYERRLAGSHGQRGLVVGADGSIQRVVSETDPEKGNDIYLTIKAPVQHRVDTLLAQLVAPVDNTIGTGSGDSASAVVMDVRDGSIIALGSYPTYTPESFVGSISEDMWSLYTSEESYYPLLNRAIGGQYAAASTFKAFTGMAGLTYGFANTSETWYCSGSWDGFDTGSAQKCWERSGHGNINFRNAVVNSCDTVFYEIGKSFFQAGESQGGSISDTAMQDFVMEYGFGSVTGIDIPGEESGRVPTPTWKAKYWADVPEEATWVGGDLTNLVIGQGDVLVTPLQVAVAYGAIASGTLWVPHLFKEARNSSGDVVLTHESEAKSVPDVDADVLAIMRDALHGVGTDNSTVAAIFNSYGIDAAAKTGTAEYSDGSYESAWFACYAPYDDPKYVVACQVNHGGGGSAVAAPLGAEILAAALSAEEGTLEETMSAIAGSSGKSVETTATSSGRTD